MRKSILFGGSILCLFILISLSYQPIMAEEQLNNNYNIFQYEETIRAIYLGTIYNLSYSEIYFNDTLYKFHNFSCSKVLFIVIYRIFPFIRILKDGFQTSIIESTNESYNFYYKGYIGENFVSAIQIFKF